jgi:glycosyltransferase involved in cell wall biosynthesis
VSAHAATSVLLAVEQLRRPVPGGIGTYARGLLSGLAQAEGDGGGDEIEVTLLASRRPGSLAPWRPHTVDPLERYGKPMQLSRLPRRMMTRAWDRGLVRAPSGYDIVHSVTTAAPLAARSGGHSRIVTVHDLAWRRHPEATTGRGRRWHETSLRRAIESSASIVVPSRLVAADLITSGVDEARITIAPGGTDHLAEPDREATQVLLRQVGVTGEFVLTVGTLEPRKNLGRLVRAFTLARSSFPSPWPLVVVGPRGWRGGHSIASDDGVAFTGAVSEVALAGLYASARAVAYVPLTEGYGLPPLEAMRTGTPTVVARGVPSVNDLDGPDDAPSRLVDPLDVEDIAAGLLDVMTNDRLRRDLVGRGATYVRSRTWRATAEAHVALWRSLR